MGHDRHWSSPTATSAQLEGMEVARAREGRRIEHEELEGMAVDPPPIALARVWEGMGNGGVTGADGDVGCICVVPPDRWARAALDVRRGDNVAPGQTKQPPNPLKEDRRPVSRVRGA